MLCSLALMSFLTACSADDSTSSVEPSDPQHMHFRMTTENYGKDGQTRGTPLSALEESVGMFAYIYDDYEWNTGSKEYIMFNEELQTAGEGWTTVGVFDIISNTEGKNKSMRYYAYYPFGLDETTLKTQPNELWNDAPYLTYTVPANVADQRDLMAGYSVDGEGALAEYPAVDFRKDDKPVTVHLRHLLTAVAFQIGKCSDKGTVNRLTLKNVLGTNTYRMNMTSEGTLSGWDLKKYSNASGSYTDFSVDLNVKINSNKKKDGTYDDDVTPQPLTNEEDGTNVLLMLPQTLPDGDDVEHGQAWLVVEYTCGGKTRELEVSIANLKWLQGKKVTYTLDITSLTQMTIKSTITPWNEGHDVINGQASDGINIATGSTINGWTPEDDIPYSSDAERQ